MLLLLLDDADDAAAALEEEKVGLSTALLPSLPSRTAARSSAERLWLSRPEIRPPLPAGCECRPGIFKVWPNSLKAWPGSSNVGSQRRGSSSDFASCEGNVAAAQQSCARGCASGAASALLLGQSLRLLG